MLWQDAKPNEPLWIKVENSGLSAVFVADGRFWIWLWQGGGGVNHLVRLHMQPNWEVNIRPQPLFFPCSLVTDSDRKRVGTHALHSPCTRPALALPGPLKAVGPRLLPLNRRLTVRLCTQVSRQRATSLSMPGTPALFPVDRQQEVGGAGVAGVTPADEAPPPLYLGETGSRRNKRETVEILCFCCYCCCSLGCVSAV